jgi:hypothetical protein
MKTRAHFRLIQMPCCGQLLCWVIATVIVGVLMTSPAMAQFGELFPGQRQMYLEFEKRRLEVEKRELEEKLDRYEYDQRQRRWRNYKDCLDRNRFNLSSSQSCEY